MLIEGTSVTVNYKKIEGIKRAYYGNEELLKPFFNEATVLPVPDDAPADIPRIIIKTLGEHSQLSISLIAATLVVHYDTGYERDWDKCAKYLTDRMEKVLEFLNVLTNNEYNYIGLVSNVLYDEVEKSGTKKLTNNLLKAEKINDIFDINIRYTFVKDERKYINIMLQNARLYKDSDANRPGSFNVENQTNESIGAVIDINDRYGFNMNEDYKTDADMINVLIEEMGTVINTKLEGLVERGEY